MSIRFGGTALDGQTVTLAVNGGLSLSQPLWGGGGDGGTLGITVSRTNLQVAPDSVRFLVDLSSTTFDTPAPSGGEIYDARLHDILYFWDFDDPGVWTAPENVLAAWTNSNVGKGPFVVHMFKQAGTYNASVLAFEPSSGKTATANVQIVVADPDVAIPNIWAVNPVGDSDFSAAPSGATQVNSDSVTETDFAFGTTPNYIAFKGGETFDCSIDLSGVQGETLFGSYGTGKAILEGPNKDSNAANGIFYWTGGYGLYQNPPHDLRFADLILQDSFDPAVLADWSNNYSTAMRAQGAHTTQIMSNVDIRGIPIALVSYNISNNTVPIHMHLDNCSLTDFGGAQYQVFLGGEAHPDSTFALTGTLIKSKEDAVAFRSLTRSPVRVVSVPKCYVAGYDGYMTEPDHAHLRLCGTPYSDGAIINVHSCASEGGDGAIVVFGNSVEPVQGLGRSPVGNVIVDGIIHVGNWATRRLMDVMGTGVTLRNSLFVMPNIQYVTAPVLTGFVRVRDSVVQGAYDATVADAPIRVYSNTLVNERDAAKNNSHVPGVFERADINGIGYSAVTESNNIVHAPNETVPRVSFVPLEDSATALWAPRNPGWRDPADGVLKTLEPNTGRSCVTPANAVQKYLPLLGSAALGAAISGDVAWDSLGDQGTARSAPADAGAW